MAEKKNETEKPRTLFYNTESQKIARKKAGWQATSILLMILCLLLLAANIFIAAMPKKVPYVIEVSADGSAKYIPDAVTLLDEWSPAENTIRYFLESFIVNLRSVSTDRQITTQNLLKVYAMMDQNAANSVKEYVKTTDPVNRGKSEKVTVTVFNISKLSDKTYQVDWRETVSSAANNKLISDKQYRATIQITFYTPRTESQLEGNPIGLWVSDISISSIKDI